jgi:hypothetical protein
MKIANKSFVLIMLLILSATFTFAQRGERGGDPTERAKEQTVEMTEKLSLSTKQAEKVGEINLKYANKLKEARDANPDGDWSAMRETMMQIRQEQNAELKNVMTAAQFEQWEKILEERRNQRREKSGQRSPKDKEQKTQENQG